MNLFSRVYGKGSPLIIIHGLFGMSDNWNTLGKKFAENFEVHILDLRNHGRSPHSNHFDFDVMCDDLRIYLEKNKLTDVNILGHSLGGKVAMNFAFIFPKKIHKLIVVDISPRKYNTDFHQNILSILYKIDIESLESRKDVDDALSLHIEQVSIRQFLAKNLYRNTDRKFSWRFNLETLLEKLSNIQNADFIDGTCNVQTCFVRGGNSDYISDLDRTLIKSYFSNVKIVTVDGAGHWVHAESPEIFYKETMSFLTN